jgi:hypothetical protein
MDVFDIVMEQVAWQCQAHTSSIDFRRFSHDYQTHPSPRLTSAGFSMTISSTPIDLTDFSRFFNDYIKHPHRLDWLQQVFPWIYQIHPSHRLTSAGSSMTISNTPIASTDFSRFFHDYIKHIQRFDWLKQVFPWLCLIYSWKNLLKSVEAMGVFDIVMEKPAEVSRGDGCVWYSHGKTCWSQSKRWVRLI